MTARLDEVRKRWISVRNQYDEFGGYIVACAWQVGSETSGS